jgi:transketolase
MTIRTYEMCDIDMRDAYCASLMELAGNNEKVVALDADLMVAMGMKPFKQAFPDRFIDTGVMEANMFGVAAGMSAVGAIPFAHTFAVFASRRALDQIFLSGAYAKLNVKVIGSDPGILAEMNGGTHMAFEDMGIMNAIPEMTVIEPTDISMLKALIPQMANKYGMFYMRLVRRGCVKIYDDNETFEIGKAKILRTGFENINSNSKPDVAIIASGYCVAEACKAAEMLSDEGFHSRVIDMFTWSPVDIEQIVESAEVCGCLVTAENHRISNGLGTIVSSVLAQKKPVPVEMIGVGIDEFGEVGEVGYLSERYGLNANHIADAARKVIARKSP